MNSIRLIVNSFDNILPGKSNYKLTSQINNDDNDQQPDQIDEQSKNLPQLDTTNDILDNIDESKDLQDHTTNIIKGPCKLPNSLKIEQEQQDQQEEEDLDELDIENEDEVNLTDHDEKEQQQIKESSITTNKPQSIFLNFLWAIWKIIFFLPNYLIIKPIIIIIKIIIFPFILLKSSLGFGNTNKSNIQNNLTYDEKNEEFESSDIEDDPLVTREKTNTKSKQQPPQSKEQTTKQKNQQYNDYEDEKILQIKKDNILLNKIKSPTSFSKYMIPPPQRLYPLSRNPTKKRKKKILILDLDETLIHSISKSSPRSFSGGRNSNTKVIEIKLNNISSLYYVNKRPYCDYFLTEIFKWFELQIFTASVKEYADPIINWLEEEIIESLNKQNYFTTTNNKPEIFTKRYYRSDCSYRPGIGYIKDLNKYIKEDDLKNVMILDNSPISYSLHEKNAISIEGWINDSNDKDLLNLLPLLYSLSLCIDVRYILGLKEGEKLFE
ncbi:NEM1 [Candida pseudojiufengensis]|uniref:NEM1 n=1 Tax=Candida pseudojiufengensis TaxID=497109 RepID=UPI0022241184|nr:NEM1 [Candida pseudojiufengensis]KAI5965780.1 NEM1 [Candida pseudojiufengensis]